MIDALIGDRIGGPGLYSGGATALAGLPGGTSYPAFDALVIDEGGLYRNCRSAGPVPMRFCVVSAGACTAYLVAKNDGGWEVVVRLTVNAPPLGALALGAGSVVNGAFTSWVPAGGSPVQTYQARGHLSGGAVAVTSGGDPQTIGWNVVMGTGIALAAGVFTLPADGGGTYLISGKIEWSGQVGGQRAIYLYRGGTFIDLVTQSPPNGATFSLNFSRPFAFTGGETFAMKAYQDSGGPLTMRDGPTATNVQLYRLDRQP